MSSVESLVDPFGSPKKGLFSYVPNVDIKPRPALNVEKVLEFLEKVVTAISMGVLITLIVIIHTH